MNRRRILQLGAASLISLRAGGPGSLSCASAAPRILPLHRVIFDERRPAARAFAGNLRALAVPTLGFDGDVTDFWYDDLDLRWREAPCPIAGLTAEGALFCLERLAWDRGLRVVWRARHRPLPDGTVEHVLQGPFGTRSRFCALCAVAPWERAAATVIATAAASSATCRSANRSAPGFADESWPEPLVSWMIARSPSAAARPSLSAAGRSGEQA
jgi:hypothetical protein